MFFVYWLFGCLEIPLYDIMRIFRFWEDHVCGVVQPGFLVNVSELILVWVGREMLISTWVRGSLIPSGIPRSDASS